MSVPTRIEGRLLTQTEREAVERTHHPAIGTLSRRELGDLLRLVRDYRDKARDVARERRRAQRGKGTPRGASRSADESGLSVKRQIFAQATKRLNREIARLDEAGDQDQVEIARKALKMKRRNRVRHHPSAGRTRDRGMVATPNETPTVEPNPAEVGRVSQFVKDAQAKRDSR